MAVGGRLKGKCVGGRGGRRQTVRQVVGGTVAASGEARHAVGQALGRASGHGARRSEGVERPTREGVAGSEFRLLETTWITTAVHD